MATALSGGGGSREYRGNLDKGRHSNATYSIIASRMGDSTSDIIRHWGRFQECRWRPTTIIVEKSSPEKPRILVLIDSRYDII